jgi:polysaccharide export outer membrane protein
MRTPAQTFIYCAALLLCIAVPVAAGAQAQPQAQAQPVPSNPSSHINSGDQLNVQVFGEPTLSQVVTVQDDGAIQYPLVGRIEVGGKTPGQASAAIADALLKYVRHPIVTVALSQEGQNNVLVLGNVKMPGKYIVRSGAHLSDAVAAAGGLGTTNGTYPDARVTQDDGKSAEVSLQELLVDGKSQLNVPINNNAVVYVEGPLPIQIEVVGAVDHPGYYTVHQGDRLSVAIAQAGTSVNAKSDLNNVVVSRDMDGKIEKDQVNMYQALHGGDRAHSDPVLEKDDVVYVPQAKQGNAFNPIYLIENLIGIGTHL